MYPHHIRLRGPWECEPLIRAVRRPDGAAFRPEDGGWGDVALEIRCTAYLRDVRAWRNDAGVVQVAGEVAGTAESSLELYVLGDRRTLGYATLSAGENFLLALERIS